MTESESARKIVPDPQCEVAMAIPESAFGRKAEEAMQARVSFGCKDPFKDPFKDPYNDFRKDDPDSDDDREDKLFRLTESTHSLLFTEEIFSFGFVFAVSIASMSYISLMFAFQGGIHWRSVDNRFGIPVQVCQSVRGSQYLALFIGLIMEEEIPQALCLLRAISRDSLRQKLPQIKFWKFVASAMVRLVMGYIFLLNMFLVIIQASDALEIFYNILALQFVQQIDDVAFNLAKNGLFGKRLRRATSRKYFRVEFEKAPFLLRRRTNLFFKAVYFLNMACLLTGMIIVSVRQDTGCYQCRSITVNFGEEVWENAMVQTPSGPKEMVLLYSYFNGLYKYNGTEHGYPVYVEQNKFDGTSFEDRTGAVIKYCHTEQAWVFTHENIRKSGDTDETLCPWLLRSPVTVEYSLLEVPSEWTIWTGIIQNGAHISVSCDECKEESDCNYHGVCSSKKCECSGEEGYFGAHCEHEDPCLMIVGDKNDTWYRAPLGNSFFRTYDRPVYLCRQGCDWVSEGDEAILVYTGSRWFAAYFEGLGGREEYQWVDYAHEFHGFWEEVYTSRTRFVSDPTTESSPIGVDFYEIQKRGDRYGPYGLLYPLQYPPGSGYYGCDTNFTSFYD